MIRLWPMDLNVEQRRHFYTPAAFHAVFSEIAGHKTRSIFDRYNVVDENDVRSAMTKDQSAQKAAVEALEVELRSSPEVGRFEAVSDNCLQVPLAGRPCESGSNHLKDGLLSGCFRSSSWIRLLVGGVRLRRRQRLSGNGALLHPNRNPKPGCRQLREVSVYDPTVWQASAKDALPSARDCVAFKEPLRCSKGATNPVQPV
jgi:hypothetical protein